MKSDLRYNIRGLAVIEFTIVSTVFLIMLFAVIELSRFVFSMQMLNEVTRKAARIATVCPVTESDKIGTFDTISSIAPIDFDSESSLVIDYLDESGTPVVGLLSGSEINTDVFVTIRYVRARIDNLDFRVSLLQSIFGDTVLMPAFETVLPSESLGVYRPLSDGSPPVAPDCTKVESVNFKERVK